MMDRNVMRFSRNTKPEPETLVEADKTSGEAPIQSAEETSRGKIVETIVAARELTEDSIFAVLALRHEIATAQALQQLILEGQVEAVGIDEKGRVNGDNFRFKGRGSNGEARTLPGCVQAMA